MVYNRVRGWTSGQSLPVINLHDCKGWIYIALYFHIFGPHQLFFSFLYHSVSYADKCGEVNFSAWRSFLRWVPERLGEQPFWQNNKGKDRILPIWFYCSLHLCACLKWMLPEYLVFLTAGQGERRLWERDWFVSSSSRYSDCWPQCRPLSRQRCDPHHPVYMPTG